MIERIKKIISLILAGISVICVGIGIPKFFNENQFNTDSIVSNIVNFVTGGNRNDNNEQHDWLNVNTQGVCDKWVSADWRWLPDVSGEHYWSYNGVLYCSCRGGTSGDFLQYQFNKNTKTFDYVIWNGFNDIDGVDVWFADGRCFYSYGNEQYELIDKTGTWKMVEWKGLSSFDGHNVWCKDDIYYYSCGEVQYKLDPINMKCEPVSWDGLTDFSGEDVWSMYGKYYYYHLKERWELNSTGNRWIRLVDSPVNMWGHYIWCYNNFWHHYSCTRDDEQKIYSTYPGIWERESLERDADYEENGYRIFWKYDDGILTDDIMCYGHCIFEYDGVWYCVSPCNGMKSFMLVASEKNN